MAGLWRDTSYRFDIPNNKYYACVTRSSLPREWCHTETSDRTAFTWYLLSVLSYRYENIVSVWMVAKLDFVLVSCERIQSHKREPGELVSPVLEWDFVLVSTNTEPQEGFGMTSYRYDLYRNEIVMCLYHASEYRSARGNWDKFVLVWRSYPYHVNNPFTQLVLVLPLLLFTCLNMYCFRWFL